MDKLINVPHLHLFFPISFSSFGLWRRGGKAVFSSTPIMEFTPKSNQSPLFPFPSSPVCCPSLPGLLSSPFCVCPTANFRRPFSSVGLREIESVSWAVWPSLPGEYSTAESLLPPLSPTLTAFCRRICPLVYHPLPANTSPGDEWGEMESIEEKKFKMAL